MSAETLQPQSLAELSSGAHTHKVLSSSSLIPLAEAHPIFSAQILARSAPGLETSRSGLRTPAPGHGWAVNSEGEQDTLSP